MRVIPIMTLPVTQNITGNMRVIPIMTLPVTQNITGNMRVIPIMKWLVLHTYLMMTMFQKSNQYEFEHMFP
jgi:hypothetical protein